MGGGEGTVIVYLAVGRVLIFFLQEAGLLRCAWRRHPLLQELHDCDLCLGVWVYTALAFFMDVGELRFVHYGLLSQVVTGACASLLMYLLRLGWNTRFQTIVSGGTDDH